MKAKIIKTSIGLISVILLSGHLCAQNLKIAFVDMEQIFQGYYKTLKAEETVKKQKEIYNEYTENLEKERETLEEDFNTLRDISQNIALSEEVREEKRNKAQTKFMLLQEKEKEMQEYQKQKLSSLRKQLRDQRNDLVKEIRNFIRGVAEKEGYDFVIDSSGNTLNEIPVFIYYQSELDITDTILAIINKGHEDEPEVEGQQE